MDNLNALFNPKSIAVIGASKNPEKLGYVLLKNVIDYGFKGNVYPVNPKEETISGLKAYPSVSSVPGPVDLVLISIPSHLVLEVVEECGSSGVKSAIVLASGFGETGGKGKEVEESIGAIAHRSGMRLLGPNCMGLYNVSKNCNCSYFWELPRIKGNIGFISQSGAYGGILFNEIRQRKIGISKFVSIGNMADLDHCDILRYLAQDDETETIALFVEGLRDGREFLEVASEVSRVKPVVAFKAGRTEAGRRAAESHTGSLAGSMEVYEAAFRQSGVILARDTEEFFDVAMALSSWVRSLPASDRVAILTISGGPCVTAADLCEELGLSVPKFGDGLRKSIREHIPFFGADSNPVDMTPQMAPRNYEACVDLVFSQGEVGGVIAMNVGLDHEEFADAFAKASKRHHRPVVCFTIDTPKLSKILYDNRIPIYPTPERSVYAYNGLVKYGRYLQTLKRGVPAKEKRRESKSLKRLSRERTKAIPQDETRDVLREYGIPVCREAVVADMKEAVRSAGDFGYPVVLKVLSSEVIHKSDSGGVCLNLNTQDELRNAWSELTRRFGSSAAFLLQEMVSGGVEVIVGGKRDSTFGPVILFGSGGILTELVEDFSVRICPISKQEARQMVEETKGYRILRGYRGKPAVDVESLLDALVKVSALLVDNPKVSQLDINPLIVKEKGVLAVDSLIVLGS